MYNHNLFFNEKYEIRGKKFDDQINEWSTKYKSLMSIEQKRFLMSIISENKIKNVLEVGIFNGVSSLCILKSGLSVNKDFHLYSIDLNNNKDFVGQAVFGFCNEEELISSIENSYDIWEFFGDALQNNDYYKSSDKRNTYSNFVTQSFFIEYSELRIMYHLQIVFKYFTYLFATISHV